MELKLVCKLTAVKVIDLSFVLSLFALVEIGSRPHPLAKGIMLPTFQNLW